MIEKEVVGHLHYIDFLNNVTKRSAGIATDLHYYTYYTYMCVCAALPVYNKQSKFLTVADEKSGRYNVGVSHVHFSMSDSSSLTKELQLQRTICGIEKDIKVAAISQ